GLPPMIGQTLGHYRIIEKIGAGGMGEVYRAHDETLDRDVALKVLPAAPLGDDTARARLLREARTASALNHPHICTIYEVGKADGQVYIAMEFVEGKPLSELVRGQGLPVETALRYGSQIADGLGHAHERGVVHRDLKSANVVITSEGRAKVLDFGLAKRLEGRELSEVTTQSQALLTQPGAVMGTLPYMAPEQLRGEPADARSDVWALGVVLHEMLVGERPFRGQTGYELSSAILNQPPPPLPAKVPVELRAVIEQCLAKEPGRRYQRAGEVRAALEAVQAGTAVVPWAVWGRKLAGRRFLALAGALAALVAVLVGLNVGGLREQLLGGVGSEQIESIAVLPLENLSGDPEQDYFAAGIHEALITDLAKLSGLGRVIARSSVMRYKGTDKPLPEIARELNVDAVITGSVLRSGDRVRITAQLINAVTEEHLWADRYERELRDVLSLQNEIVAAITREIKLQLTPQEQARLKSQRPVNPEAFEAYLKGRFHWQKQTREDSDIAERYFQFALQKDPNYALAYAGLGMVWLMRGDAGFQAPSETFPKGTAFFEKAVELDDSSAELRVSLANYKTTTQWDWSGAEREFKRAIEINPNLADAHYFYADLLLALKRTEEWKREIKRARELDPLNDFKESYYGWHLNYLGRYDEAIPIFQKLLPTGPNKASNYLGLWGAYYKKGMYDEALAAAKSYFAAIGDHEFADALGTERGEAAYRAGMKRAGEVMAARSKQRHVPAIRIARMFAHAGDKNSAIQWLEKAYQARESPLIRLGVFWDWDDLRSDPHFQSLLRRMNLPE
ncbi:MAG: protein kinase, partial [Candidatus Acidiferrales bacterium]